MIWYWLMVAYFKLRRLVAIPKPRDVAKIDDQVPCPICAWRRNRLRAVYVRQGSGMNAMAPMCQHECARCGARWFESAVVKVTTAMVMPAVARDDQERAADRLNVPEAMGIRQTTQRAN